MKCPRQLVQNLQPFKNSFWTQKIKKKISIFLHFCLASLAYPRWRDINPFGYWLGAPNRLRGGRSCCAFAPPLGLLPLQRVPPTKTGKAELLLLLKPSGSGRNITKFGPSTSRHLGTTIFDQVRTEVALRAISPSSRDPYISKNLKKYNRFNFRTDIFFIANSFDLTVSLLYQTW